MAILKNSNIKEYNKIQLIINEVFANRKYKFDKDTILDLIKEKCLAAGISSEFLDCTYFYILILNTLDKLLDNGKIYQFGNQYVVSDFMVCVDYFPVPTRLLYYINISNNIEQNKIIDIANLETISPNSIYDSDCLLCGGYTDKINSKYKLLLQTGVSLEEISSLYTALRNDGASNSEAIVCLLNYYKVQPISSNVSFVNNFFPQKPQIKKLSKKKNTHKF